MTVVAEAPFDRDRLIAEAAARISWSPRQAIDALGDDTLEALDVLLPALVHEARLTVLGRWITHRFLGRLMEQRLVLEAYTQAHPDVLDEAIVEPWFVIGAPRTGTTVLYGLLAHDERHRVPQGWEFLRPAPPATDEADVDARVALADIELRTPQVVANGLASIHAYSGRMPKECLSAMSLAFRSEEFISRYDVPSYVAWLQRCDPRPAYDMHRRVLQVLQRARPGEAKRWVLKSPVHLQAIPTLLDVYPDARLSATHRDPLSVLASVSSLIATMRSAHSDYVDAEAIGRYHLELYSASLDRLVDHVDGGVIDPGRFTSSRHVDFIDDALGVTRGLYDHFGWPLDAATQAAFHAHLAAQAEERGGHQYSLDDFGINRDAARARFTRYATRFGVG
jgi:hypothetical protein